jgi:16S rRNA (cytosine1402-N4)-methyltransferase
VSLPPSGHAPVMGAEVVAAFEGQPKKPARIFEGTFGRGGHTSLLLRHFPSATVISFDKDKDAVEYARREFGPMMDAGRFQIIHDDFRNFKNHDLGKFDGALFDLGISSPQVDQADRGFSFLNDGPLDMRMNRSQDLTAANVVNEFTEKELSDLFYHLGEVRHPNRVVRAIVHDRKETPFETTRQLASLIERVDGRGRGRRAVHPATNYFMALRIYVNAELEALGDFLESVPQALSDGARMVVISFHSLEDRIVKQAFRKMDGQSGQVINKKVIIAGEAELEANPRARSAKLRIFETGGLQ